MSVYRLCLIVGLTAGVVALSPAYAFAQYRPPGPPVVGEDYHVEIGYGWWNADPSLIVNSEALGILGTDVNLVDDLGIEKKRLGKLDIVLRPGRKHRFRFQYVPIHYVVDDHQVTREFVFNGQRYNVGLPVKTDANFETYRIGYEFDFLQFPRGFLGALVDVKYTNVDISLTSPILEEFTTAAAPIPTLGVVGRGYVTSHLAVNGEMSFFRVPENLGEQLGGDGSYTDFDLNATYNLTKNVGAQVGYRSVHVSYAVDNDNGSLKFKGMYFGGVVRF
ncbi:MAG: hypothetical protein O2973_14195 [Gemmatimonadetes bacterium]|nr:hypothetical protein [Gemmatimonadota bacterium]